MVEEFETFHQLFRRGIEMTREITAALRAEAPRYLGGCAKAPRLRKFCLALKRVMLDEKGPEIYIREKVCSALKIGARTYLRYREFCQKELS